MELIPDVYEDTLDTPLKIYLDDLYWIDDRVKEFTRKPEIDFQTYREEITFEIKDTSYTFETIQEAKERLNANGYNALNNLIMRWYSFQVLFQPFFTYIILTEKTEVNISKFYQIRDFLKVKENPNQKQIIHLFNRDEKQEVSLGIGCETEIALLEKLRKIDSTPWYKKTWVVITGIISALVGLTAIGKGIIEIIEYFQKIK